MHYARDVKKLSVTNTDLYGRLEWFVLTLNDVRHMFCYMAKLPSGTYVDAGLIWTLEGMRDELIAQSTTGMARYARIVARMGSAAEYALEHGFVPKPFVSRKMRKAARTNA